VCRLSLLGSLPSSRLCSLVYMYKYADICIHIYKTVYIHSSHIHEYTDVCDEVVLYIYIYRSILFVCRLSLLDSVPSSRLSSLIYIYTYVYM